MKSISDARSVNFDNEPEFRLTFCAASVRCFCEYSAQNAWLTDAAQNVSPNSGSLSK